MPAIGDLTGQHPVDVQFGHGAETVTVRFDRNAITLALIERVAGSTSASVLAEIFAAVILEWDVTNDDGSAFPPTVENLSLLPVSTLFALSEAILAASRPSSEEGKASPERSNIPLGDSVEHWPTLQNGRETSSSPAPLGSLSTS